MDKRYLGKKSKNSFENTQYRTKNNKNKTTYTPEVVK